MLEIYARWGTEIEQGTMSRNAARFWSRDGRAELLRPCWSMEDILEEWDEGEHGEPPQEGTDAWLEEDDLTGECMYIYQAPELLLPESGFFAEPLPAPVENQTPEAQRSIELAELLAAPGLTEFTRKPESEIYPDLAPSAWHSTTGWKGNFARWPIKVQEAVSLREVLRARPLHADVCEVDGDLHVSEISADDEYIEWDNSSGKSHEFEVAPPDNMLLWRLAATGIGRWMGLLRRASERVYVPGGTGAEAVRREFEALVTVQ